MDDLDDDCPVEVTGRTLDGWRIHGSRQQPGFLEAVYDNSEEAQAAAAELCTHDLIWVVRSTSPEGHSYFEGGHPDVMEHELHFGTGLTESVRQAQDDSIRERLGFERWWDRWYVGPEYTPTYSPVRGAIRPLAKSRYYAAPGQRGTWDVCRDGAPRPIESVGCRDEAIESATRLALGFKTANAIRRARSQRVAWVLVVTVMALLALGLNLIIPPE